MSFQVREHVPHDATTGDDICDYMDQPLDLNQENIKLFEQQQTPYPPGLPPYGHGNPMIHGPPGYVNQPPMQASPWPNNVNLGSGHDGVNYHDVSNGRVPQGVVNGYLPNMPPNDAYAKAESESSTQLSVERNLSLLQTWGGQMGSAHGNQTDSSPSGSPNDMEARSDKGKSKRQRTRILTEKEEAVMAKDDLQLTPEELKIKKKAHNRLAQRAFRERKKNELKDLEVKLLQSEEERQKLLKVLQDIRQSYPKLEENLLRTNGEAQPEANQEDARFSFPITQDDFINEMVDRAKHNVQDSTKNKVYDEPSKPGRKVLGVGAVWDYLQLKAEDYEYENVDMYEVMQLLKGNEVCHGYGPAYPFEKVEAALEQVKNSCPMR